MTVIREMYTLSFFPDFGIYVNHINYEGLLKWVDKLSEVKHAAFTYFYLVMTG